MSCFLGFVAPALKGGELFVHIIHIRRIVIFSSHRHSRKPSLCDILLMVFGLQNFREFIPCLTEFLKSIMNKTLIYNPGVEPRSSWVGFKNVYLVAQQP